VRYRNAGMVSALVIQTYPMSSVDFDPVDKGPGVTVAHALLQNLNGAFHSKPSQEA